MSSADTERASSRVLRSRSLRLGGLFILVAALLSSSLYLLNSTDDSAAKPQRAQLESDPVTKVVKGPPVESTREIPPVVESEPPKLEVSRPASPPKPKPPKRVVAVAPQVEQTPKEEMNAVPSKVPAEPVESAAADPIEEGDERETARGYFKISAAGEKLPESAEKWACVEDTATGLVWEVKSAERGLHHKGNLYSWYEPKESGEVVGVSDGGRCGGKIDCDSHAFTQALNLEKYCGYADWRVPTREELVTILEHGTNGTGVSINRDYFPEGLRSWYWTATSNKDYPEYAWYVLFRNGIALSDTKDRSKHLRLVRSEGKAG